MYSYSLRSRVRQNLILNYRSVTKRVASTQTQHPSTRFTAITHSEDGFPENDPWKEKLQYLLPVYARPPIIMECGKGLYVWDTQGRKYLDFSAGIAVNALGHGDEMLAELLREQASILLHVSNAYYNRWAGELAEKLVTLTREHGGLGLAPDSKDEYPLKVFFSNSGTEANEGALKIARRVGKDRWAMKRHGRLWDHNILSDLQDCSKTGIVCFENGFHGRSMGALSVTSNPKYQQPFFPLIPGVQTGTLNDSSSLELIGEDTCAVIVEPIQGEGGVRPATEAWLRSLRKKCDDAGAVLIYDEIQCGLFRTGALWAHSTLPVDCHPDVITMAKPLANGYPIGAIVMRDSISKSMAPGSHGTTFGGSPLACRLGTHVLGRLSEPAFLSQVEKSSAHLDRRLSKLPEFFPNLVGSIRGRGLIRGVPFVKDPSTNASRVTTMARQRGVLLLTAGNDAVRCVPSLTVKEDEIDLAVDVMESCLGLLAKGGEP